MSPEVILGAEEEDRELSDLVPEVLDVCGDVFGVVDLCWPPPRQESGAVNVFTPYTPEQEAFGRSSHLYVPSLTHMMSLYFGFLPARQSLQNQLPSGMAMLRQSGWNAAGHDSQHSSCPPAGHGAAVRAERKLNTLLFTRRLVLKDDAFAKTIIQIVVLLEHTAPFRNTPTFLHVILLQTLE